MAANRFIVAGFSPLSLAPDTLWTRVLGSGTARDVVPLYDGGFAATGEGWPTGAGNPQVRLVRTDAAGNVAWSRIYGIPPYSWPYGSGLNVFVIPGGDFLIAIDYHEPFQRTVRLLRVDSLGDSVWTGVYGTGVLSQARKLTDGGVAFLGRAGGSVSSPIFLRRTDALFNQVWNRTYSPAPYTLIDSFDEVPGGGFIISGSVRSSTSDDWDVFLLRTDASGIAAWIRAYDDSSLSQYGRRVRALPDGGFILSAQDSGKLWVLRTDVDGDTLWTRVFPGRTVGNDIDIEGDGFTIAATWLAPGQMFPRDLDVMHLDAAGQIVWSRVVGFYNQDDEGLRIAGLNDGGYIAAGYCQYRQTDLSISDIEDFWLVRFATAGQSGVPGGMPRGDDGHHLAVFPNPLARSGIVTFHLVEPGRADIRLFDPAGRLVRSLASGFREAGRHAVVLSSGGLAPGIYYVRLETTRGTSSHKVVIGTR